MQEKTKDVKPDPEGMAILESACLALAYLGTAIRQSSGQTDNSGGLDTTTIERDAKWLKNGFLIVMAENGLIP